MKAKFSIYLSFLVPISWSWVLDSDQKNKYVYTSGGNFFDHPVSGLSLRDRMRCLVIWEVLSRAAIPSHRKKPVEVTDEVPAGCLLGKVFRACATGSRPQGRTRTCCRDHISQLAWEQLVLLRLLPVHNLCYFYTHLKNLWPPFAPCMVELLSRKILLPTRWSYFIIGKCW